MRILHVITSLHIGGAERFMTILLPRLRDLGNEVELLVFDGTRTAFTDSLEKSGITIHSLGSKNVYSPVNILKLRKFINKFDVIHTHNTACQLFVPFARILAHAVNLMLVTTEHSTSNRRRGKKWFKPVDRWMYSRYERVICIGETTEKNLRYYLGENLRSLVIYNGIEIPCYKVPTSHIDGEMIVSMVAAFRVGKDQDSLVRAMTLLPERFKLRLIGDGERRAEVEKLVEDLNLQERVSFLGNRSDVPQLLQQSHINVLSSHWEGFGLSAVEGMALGIPTIVSNVSGLKEIVGGYGILFPDNDHQALAREIESLVSDRDKYEVIAKKCRQRAVQFDIADTARRYNEVYKSVIIC